MRSTPTPMAPRASLRPSLPARSGARGGHWGGRPPACFRECGKTWTLLWPCATLFLHRQPDRYPRELFMRRLWRYIIAGSSFLVIAAGVILAPAASAGTVRPLARVGFQFVNFHSALCLGIAGSSQAGGAQAVQGKCDTTGNDHS